LRNAAGIKTVERAYGQTGIVATVAFSEPHNGVAIQHFLPGGPFAILPLKDNRACITWSADKEEARGVMALDDSGFLAELDLRIGGRFGTISLAGPRQSWPLGIVMPRQLIAHRFVLIGDAAHGVHPIAGQGVNLALRDAAALVEILADAARLGLDLGAGVHLERYQRWRRFDSLMSASVYDGLNRLFGADNSVLRAGRGAALGVLDRIGSAKNLIVAEAAGVTGELPKLARGCPV
jgi:2-octaprenyl-6-methoxyphenol hydroxylase